MVHTDYPTDALYCELIGDLLFLVLITGAVLTLIKPMAKPVLIPENKELELESSKPAMFCGFLVVLATIGLYIMFW